MLKSHNLIGCWHIQPYHCHIYNLFFSKTHQFAK